MKTIKEIVLIFLFLVVVLTLAAEDYFWVGNQGKWSAIENWRTNTGQIPNEVPDANDNVIFNENSFIEPDDTVFILTGNPTCLNMTWENIQYPVVISGGSSTTTFSIHGSVTLHKKVKNLYKGKIMFLSDLPGNTITCDGSGFMGDLLFNGEGEYILQDTLFVLDTIPALWPIVINGILEPVTSDPVIIQNNGTLNSNEQVIINRGFQTNGGNPRTLIIEKSRIHMAGNWFLNADELTFEANNSYIRIRGEMNNNDGDEISYFDIDVTSQMSQIRNTNITSNHRKIHFFGSGSINGSALPGLEGHFIIDTLLFNGALTPMGDPIPCSIDGSEHSIHYSRIDLVHAKLSVQNCYFHRIDFNGIDWDVPYLTFFQSKGSVADSVLFYIQQGTLYGNIDITNLLFFNTTGILSSGKFQNSHVNHLVFSADGFLNGSNDIDSLILSSGFWYRMASDSMPGWNPTFSYRQKVGYLKVTGDCNQGMAMLTSGRKQFIAHLEYTGSELPTEFIQVRDINNYGNIIHIDQGIDDGNNFGFVFSNQAEPRTLYWVGGAGRWTDNEHWSLAPGQVPGDQCPPTIRDDVYFNSLSGFQTGGQVQVDQKHAGVNNMFWGPLQNRATLFCPDTTSVYNNTLHIRGSVELDKSMTFSYLGDVIFESEYDESYETIDLRNTYVNGLGQLVYVNHLFRKVFFNGPEGKWKILDSEFAALNDTTFLIQGELMVDNNTMDLVNFQATDTLKKGMYMFGRSLIKVHQFNANAWDFNAYRVDSLTFFDAGRSTIIAYGDIALPPDVMTIPGMCNIRLTGEPLQYYNLQFSDPDIGGENDWLFSSAPNKIHRLDYYTRISSAISTGIIDTLTWHEEANQCSIKNNFEINFLYSESEGDSIVDNHVIDSIFLYNDNNIITGQHQVGYLQSSRFVKIAINNVIDTAILFGNATILGTNHFSQIKLSPNKRYTFQHHKEGQPGNFQTVDDDFIIQGDCDGPIRLQSDSIGTAARILYKAQDPTYPEVFAKYSSFRDITMIPYENIVNDAYASVNLGNNENINFYESNNEIYYWVGGNGKWSDWTHWSFESGGEPIAERCIPKEINTVIFDDNSFNSDGDSVFIDVLNAYCKSMWWKNSMKKPLFYGSDSTFLFIYGSMMLSENMDYKYAGLLLFDQFEENGDIADTITTKGHLILNHMMLQGLSDTIILGDDYKNFVDLANQIYSVVFHTQGAFILNGYHLDVGAYMSNYKTPRLLNLDNSTVTVYRPSELDDFGRYFKSYWLNADSLQFSAENSLIINEAILGNVFTENGEYLKYNNVIFNGARDSLSNSNNVVEYNMVRINGAGGVVTSYANSHFVADTILLNSPNSAILKNSSTRVIYLDGGNCMISGIHHINRCFVNKRGYITAIGGNNEIKYCVFKDDGYFRGENIFDTLVLFPGEGNFQNQGNWYRFEDGKTQYINDSLYLRGNQCSNINITSLRPPNLAFLKIVNGKYDISCDYVNIRSVGVESNGIDVYAGINSTPLPNPNNPPPGWIFDNAQGYVYGFNGKTVRFCYGENYLLKTNSFNGDPLTLYFWEGSSVPGGSTYRVTEPGTYHIRVEYFDGCFVEDKIIVEADLSPIARLDPGPYCAGDLIHANVFPDYKRYTFLWSTGDTTQTIRALLGLNNSELSVVVIDTTSSCSGESSEVVFVKPSPDPEIYLGDDVWISYGQKINLDAGPGDTWLWNSNPPTDVVGLKEQKVTVSGLPDDSVVYRVNVTLDGCDSTGYKVVNMYPPNKLGLPTAFSPNGDGINDVYQIFGSGFSEIDFRIYDRYGKLVFETTDPSQTWDGTVDGKKQEEEVYTYYIRVVFQDKEVAEQSGNITILR